jgi:cytochrome c-type biogenesis protein CcmH
MAHRAFVALCAALLATLALVRTLPAFAVDPAELADPALQARYVTLIHELRCVQCQNEALADSEVGVAGEVRGQIRTMLLQGKSDKEIKDYLVSRYSEFILFRPRYSWRNAWLWSLPVVLLVIGLLVAARIIRARAALVEQDGDPVEEDEFPADAIRANAPRGVFSQHSAPTGSSDAASTDGASHGGRP